MTGRLERLFDQGRGGGLKAKLLQGALGVGGLKLLSLPLTMAASILLARGLGPEGYGQYAFVMALTSMLAIPIGPGVGRLVTREVAKFHYDENWGLFRGLLLRAHQWVILGSAAIVLVTALFSGWNATWEVNDRWTLLLVATLTLPILGLNALRSATLQGLRLVSFGMIPELLAQPALHLFIASCLLLAGVLSPVTALLSQISAMALALCVGAWMLWKFKPRELRQAQPTFRGRAWAHALLPFSLLVAVGALNGQIGILMLGWLGTSEEVAALRVAMSGSILVMLSLNIVNMVIGPHITRVHRENDKVNLRRLSRQSARAASAVAFPIALPMIFFGEDLIHLLYGNSYVVLAVLPMAILAFGQLLNVAFGSVGLLLVMSGHERDSLMGQVFGLMTNLVLAILLIPLYGVTGAALATTAGIILWNVFLASRCIKRLGFRPSVF